MTGFDRYFYRVPNRCLGTNQQHNPVHKLKHDKIILRNLDFYVFFWTDYSYLLYID